MAFEKRDNSGTLGRNDKKTETKHPDHKGSATINGVDYWISAWIKEGPTGKFFSLGFTRKDTATSPNSVISPDERKKIEDDEISF